MRILIIEDDVRLCDSLRYQMEQEGYAVDVCHDGADGWELIRQESADVILLDRMLPSMDGITILHRTRSLGITTPILMVTALGELSDRVMGLDGGADDYIVKPFEYEELMARIRCIIRRPPALSATELLTCGDLSYHFTTRRLGCGSRTLLLSKREGTLLEFFLRNCGQTLPRSLILARVWGPDAEVEDGNLDNYIHFLRRRLSSVNSTVQLKTIRGIGYCLEESHV
ncbi:response regulator transcription factor [Hespellia stercorisuis]|uniref:Stage 0 sporulation protein A homolog n=1 Tax=Hespellia stercorisuis DSM 15480 TaxID=1121950 RepID=A0A1M6MNM3_9FIRM|nr:response regulator transcription factor [Hespellia stercorisuis]SHJ84873.1 DNA-binding response regulator, OmpR family, contains REC and winged-helix (wHTH) domain [Hespellia stercorisuis DSM 15480]